MAGQVPLVPVNRANAFQCQVCQALRWEKEAWGPWCRSCSGEGIDFFWQLCCPLMTFECGRRHQKWACLGEGRRFLSLCSLSCSKLNMPDPPQQWQQS